MSKWNFLHLRSLRSQAADSPLSINQAHVSFIDSRLSCTNITVNSITAACFECLFQLLASNTSCSVDSNLDSNYPTRFEVNGVSTTFHFEEGGVYSAVVTDEGLNIVVRQSPISRDLPVLYAALILTSLCILCRAVLWLWQRKVSRSVSESLEELPLNNLSEVAPQQKKVRLRSLDAFRGFCLSVMIFVNYGGGFYYYFQHSIWNGLTVADLVFPWFVFIMGSTLGISYDSSKRKGWFDTFKRTGLRVAALFCYGLLIATANDPTGNDGIGGTNFATLRIPGVLQRFAISYAGVTAIIQISSTKIEEGSRFCIMFRDLVEYYKQWITVFGLILLWIVITFCVPVSGCPTGYLGPGGLEQEGKFYNCTGGIASVIDRWILGDDHVYHYGTYVEVYRTSISLDPEGILGSLNSIVICYLGVVGGRIVRNGCKEPRQAVFRLLGWGASFCIIGGCLCGFSQNSGPIPVNKNLWSTSFIFVLAGFGVWLLSLFFVIVDVKSWWDGAPFSFLGMNSILVYMGSELLQQRISLAVPQLTHAWLLFSNLLSVSLWFIFAFWLHHNKWYFAV